MAHLEPAVSYGRFSDKKQVGNHSLEIQDEAIVRAAGPRGYKIEAKFLDEGVSAYRRRASQRPGMRDLVEYVLSHDCAAVFFYDESRVSRQVTDFVSEVWEEIGSHKPNVKFFSASLSDEQEWDPDDLQTQLRLVLASEESAIKSRRAVDSQRMHLNPERPKRPGSKAPFGFTAIEGVLHPNEDAVIVYFVFHLASWGYGDEKIAEVLNYASVPSPSGSKWNASTIDLVLNHKAHLGHLSWNVRKSAGNSARKPEHQISLFQHVHDPIVPAYLWEMVYGLRRLKKNTGIKFSTSNLLGGIVRCKSCNVLLKAKDQSPSGAKGKYVKYQCSNCGKKVSAHELHKIVFERVVRDWSGDVQVSKLETRAKGVLNRWQRLLEKERKGLLASKAQAIFGLHSGNLSSEIERSFRVALNHIDDRLREIQALENRVHVLQTDQELPTLLRRFENGVFEQLSDMERRAFLIAALDSIKITFGIPTRIVLEYRLSPYVGLENEIGHLTEMDGQTLGEKPKAQ